MLERAKRVPQDGERATVEPGGAVAGAIADGADAPEGMTNEGIVAELWTGRDKVYRWRRRFVAAIPGPTSSQ